jgi:hypothetical protein
MLHVTPLFITASWFFILCRADNFIITENPSKYIVVAFVDDISTIEEIKQAVVETFCMEQKNAYVENAELLVTVVGPDDDMLAGALAIGMNWDSSNGGCGSRPDALVALGWGGLEKMLGSMYTNLCSSTHFFDFKMTNKTRLPFFAFKRVQVSVMDSKWKIPLRTIRHFTSPIPDGVVWINPFGVVKQHAVLDKIDAVLCHGNTFTKVTLTTIPDIYELSEPNGCFDTRERNEIWTKHGVDLTKINLNDKSMGTATSLMTAISVASIKNKRHTGSMDFFIESLGNINFYKPDGEDTADTKEAPSFVMPQDCQAIYTKQNQAQTITETNSVFTKISDVLYNKTLSFLMFGKRITIKTFNILIMLPKGWKTLITKCINEIFLRTQSETTEDSPEIILVATSVSVITAIIFAFSVIMFISYVFK